MRIMARKDRGESKQSKSAPAAIFGAAFEQLFLSVFAWLWLAEPPVRHCNYVELST